MHSCNNTDIHSSETRKEKYENKICTKKSMPTASFLSRLQLITSRGERLESRGVIEQRGGAVSFFKRGSLSGPDQKAWIDCEGALTGPPLLDSAKRRSISELCVNLLGGD